MDHPNPTKSNDSPLPLSRGKIVRPQKAVIYGPEGVGKSTLASQLPSPVFLDTEGGTHHLDVARFADANTWEAITVAVTQLTTTKHGFRTLVVDTVDWAERRLAEHLCRKANKDSIEDFGYGRGYVLMAEGFAKFLASFDALLARGIHIVFLAHSTVKKFESPDQAGGYDRYELKLNKQVAPLVREWADAIFFCNFVTRVAERDSGRMRGVGGKERALFANHTAAYDAKNRHGLPDRLAFSPEALEPVFGHGTAPEPQQPPASEAKKETSQEERLTELIPAEMHVDAAGFLVARDQIKADRGFGDVPEEYAARIIEEPQRFLDAVRGWASEQTPQTTEKEGAVA